MLSSPSPTLTLRPYQSRAVESLLCCHRGILVIPAGGGKTFTAVDGIDRLVSNSSKRLRVVWLANTLEQVNQALEAIGRRDLFTRAHITVTCVAAAPDVSGADLVVVDEAHHVASDSWALVLSKAKGRVWGLTATPFRADDRAADVFRLIGPIVCEVTREEIGAALAQGIVEWRTAHLRHELVQAVGRAASPEIIMQLRWTKAPRDEVEARIVYRHAFRLGVLEHRGRDRMIFDLANEGVTSGSSVLVIVASIEHGTRLAAEIPGSRLVHSKIGKKARSTCIEMFRSGELTCLLATSLADEGLDVPRADTLILACGGRSAAKIEQRTGRVLRAFDGKTHGRIIDFWDEGHGMLLAQSRARSRVYQRLQYRETWVAAQPGPLVGAAT